MCKFWWPGCQKMANPIRYFRKERGWTLAQVAARLGTTPQTVSRLETEMMTVSTDWLQRFAAAFGVHMADLLEPPEGREIPFLGLLSGDGVVTSGRGERRSIGF